AVNLYACNGKNSQTKILHEVLNASAQSEQSAAILLADESLLVPLLQSLPDVKPNITTGYPLAQSPIYGLLNLWMDTQEEISHHHRLKVPFQYIETFVNYPLTGVSLSERVSLFQDSADKRLVDVDICSVTIPSSIWSGFFLAVIALSP